MLIHSVVTRAPSLWLSRLQASTVAAEALTTYQVRTAAYARRHRRLLVATSPISAADRRDHAGVCPSALPACPARLPARRRSRRSVRTRVSVEGPSGPAGTFLEPRAVTARGRPLGQPGGR